VLGEVRHRLVDVFLWQLLPDGLQGDFLTHQWSASAKVYGTYPAWCSRRDTTAGSNMESLAATYSSQ